MFIQMLKNQQTTFVNDVQQAMDYSPFYVWYNVASLRWCVSKDRGFGETPELAAAGSPAFHSECVAAGMDQEEAHACVMFKANEFIRRGLSYCKVQGV